MSDAMAAVESWLQLRHREAVAQADELARLRVGQLTVHLELRAQPREQRLGAQRRVGVGRQRVLVRPLLAHKVAVERRVRAGDGKIIGERRARRQRQRVLPDDPPVFQQLDEPQQLLVERRVVRRRERSVQLERIHAPVRHQCLAVPVGQDAARGHHRLALRVRADGPRAVLRAVYDLRVKERHEIRRQHQREEHADREQASAELLFVVHGRLLPSRFFAVVTG